MYVIKSKKGMKFNKFTHLSIILVLAIVFIVVYLYYTISDVKKIHNEVSKLTGDIAKLNTSISSITSTLSLMLAPQPTSAPQCSAPAPGTAAVCVMPPSPVVLGPAVEVESSVDSQELKTIMETIEDEDKQEQVVQAPKSVPIMYDNDVANLEDLKDVEELMAATQARQTLKDAPKLLDITTIGEPQTVTSINTEDLTKLSLDELKKVSYDAIRKYCKDNGLNYKGSKDVLIYRIKGITA